MYINQFNLGISKEILNMIEFSMFLNMFLDV